jgi:hypothetical protein
VLGHHHVTGDYETIALSRLLKNLQIENLQKQIAPRCAGEPGLAMITTTGKEMQMVSPVVALETLRHLPNCKSRRRLNEENPQTKFQDVRIWEGPTPSASSGQALAKNRKMGHL